MRECESSDQELRRLTRFSDARLQKGGSSAFNYDRKRVCDVAQPRSEELPPEFLVIGQGEDGGSDQLSSSSKSSLDPAILKEDFADR